MLDNHYKLNNEHILGGGGTLWLVHEHDNLHFDIHMSSKNDEQNNYDLNLDLDLLTIYIH